MRRRRGAGQVATEYLLAISVVVVAIVLAGGKLEAPLRAGWTSFSQAYETFFAESGGPQ